MDKKYFFVGGLPRSGSTLLVHLLRQHPDIYADDTSGLVNYLFHLTQINALEDISKLSRHDSTALIRNLCELVAKDYYADVEQHLIIDKNRGWTADELRLATYLTPTPRVVVLVRPITEIVKSFAFYLSQINELPNWSQLFEPQGFFTKSINNLAYALQNVSPKYFFVTYDQLVKQPKIVLKEIHDFWQIEPFEYESEVVAIAGKGKDSAFAVLHDVREKIEKRSYKVVLPQVFWDKAVGLDQDLWHDFKQAKSLLPSAFCNA